LAFVTLMALSACYPGLRIWPLLWVVPFMAYVGLVAAVQPFRATFRPWRFGRVNRLAIIATLIITLGSCAVLVAFDLHYRPDVRAYRSFLPVTALGGIFAAGVIFSIFNALFEELTFRGILFDAIESQWGVWVGVVATALLFGYGHLRGYPAGSVGAVLAGIYGLCLGWLRVYTGGIGLPVLAHIAADATIYTLVARAGAL